MTGIRCPLLLSVFRHCAGMIARAPPPEFRLEKAAPPPNYAMGRHSIRRLSCDFSSWRLSRPRSPRDVASGAGRAAAQPAHRRYRRPGDGLSAAAALRRLRLRAPIPIRTFAAKCCAIRRTIADQTTPRQKSTALRPCFFVAGGDADSCYGAPVLRNQAETDARDQRRVLRSSRHRSAGRGERRRTARRAQRGGQGHVRHRRQSAPARGNPTWLATHAPPQTHAAAVAKILARRRDHHRQDDLRRAVLQRHRHQRALRRAGQSARARADSRRLVERIGRRHGRGRLRLCARQRYRRLGPRARRAVRHLRPAADPRPRRSHRRRADGALLRHLRVVRTLARRAAACRRRAARRRSASTRRSAR